MDQTFPGDEHGLDECSVIRHCEGFPMGKQQGEDSCIRHIGFVC